MWRAYAITMLLLIGGCSEQQTPKESDTLVLSVWAHGGQATERGVLERQVKRFNSEHTDLQIELSFLPEQSYNAQVQAAAVAGELPDLLEVDGPYLYNYIWQGHLAPLDSLLAPEIQSNLIPSVSDQGRYKDRLYGVGVFDSGLGIYARRSTLSVAGIRIPRGPEEAWSKTEFEEILSNLAARDEDGRVLDLKLNYTGEWFTYALSPLLQSAGADLIDRQDYQSAAGILNGPSAVAAMESLQDWLVSERVDPNLDDAAFVSGRVALSWAGHWEYPRYAETIGEDLVVLPLPDMGRGSRTGQGSWLWSISSHSENQQQAATFIAFLLRTGEVLEMTSANGAVPATRSAIRKSAHYGDNGPLHLFSRQLLDGYSIPRPKTPAYPIITSAFQRVVADIRANVPVQSALDTAVKEIDRDIRDNKGYPPLR